LGIEARAASGQIASIAEMSMTISAALIVLAAYVFARAAAPLMRARQAERLPGHEIEDHVRRDRRGARDEGFAYGHA